MERVQSKNLCSFFVNPKACIGVIFGTVAFCFLSSFAGPVFAEDAGGEPRWHTVHMRVTAYCPCAKCCGEWSDGVTATGHKIFQGDRFAAADRRYAFGTEMVITGYNNGEIVKVLDRGGAIKGDRLDVFFNTHEEALQWGVQYIDVKIRG
ncbi:MAG: hypothetical protein FVQ79_00890 [Planctomycetes bacterium]|nr:hypothetical protein [Planctomycetota bacterium]